MQKFCFRKRQFLSSQTPFVLLPCEQKVITGVPLDASGVISGSMGSGVTSIANGDFKRKVISSQNSLSADC